MATRCRRCKRPLRDPISVSLGIGPVCRTKSKYQELKDKQENMFGTKASYTYTYYQQYNVLAIIDVGAIEAKSVTNDMENVLKEIWKQDGERFAPGIKTMYKDSQGVWDEVRYGITMHTNGTFELHSITFHPITEKEFEKAIAKLTDTNLEPSTNKNNEPHQ